jgi:hypothetical protein
MAHQLPRRHGYESFRVLTWHASVWYSACLRYLLRSCSCVVLDRPRCYDDAEIFLGLIAVAPTLLSCLELTVFPKTPGTEGRE